MMEKAIRVLGSTEGRTMSFTDPFEASISAADPAVDIAVPDGRPAMTRWRLTSARFGQAPEHRRPARARTLLVVTLVAACALILSLIFVTRGSPSSAASELLTRTAHRAMAAPAIPSGEYEYQQTSITQQVAV
jgi:hypothetical protein